MQYIDVLRYSVSLLTTATISCSFVISALANDGANHQIEIANAKNLLASETDMTTTTTTGVGKYNVPISDTTTREKINDPGPTEQITKKHTVYTRLSPASASQTIVETEDSNSIKHGRLNYSERLRDFRSQLDKAIESNWVDAAQAADLNSQYSGLVAKETEVRKNDYPKAECDDFDTRLNAFNIHLSDAMSKGSKK